MPWTKPGGKRLVHATLAPAHRRGEAFACQAPRGVGLNGANASPLPALVVLRQACPERSRRAQHERVFPQRVGPIPFTLSLSKGEQAW
jgi:hypothetical protein